MDQKKIGKFIAGCRREAGMTQQALSERLGVSDRTVGNWENGRNLPDPSLYKPLCPAALFTDLFNRACFCRNVPLLFRRMHKGNHVSAEHRQKKKQHGNGLLQQPHPRVHYPEADRKHRLVVALGAFTPLAGCVRSHCRHRRPAGSRGSDFPQEKETVKKVKEIGSMPR